jgi:YHS domain-containing protein
LILSEHLPILTPTKNAKCMKKYWLLAIFFMALIITSCSKSENENANQKEGQLNVEKVKLDSDKDPVCQMSVKDHPEDTATYNGKVYGFCNPGCKAEFKKDPQKYIK